MARERGNPVTLLRVRPGRRPQLSDRAAASTLGWEKDKSQEKTERNLEKLEELQYHLYADGGKSLLIVLQGIDAAGKDGVIRKVFTAFNPQGTHVTSFKVPAGREVAHDFLWRVHAACPPRGSIGIFNRSHYEDLIVPMLNESISRKQLAARIDHINSFERMLTDEGTTIVKFLLHISRDEQWERLMARLDEPNRNWKFRMGDLAERQRWDQYLTTFTRVVSSTSTEHAPWFVIPANSKWFRDYAVSKIVVSALQGMKLQWPKPSADVKVARRELERLR
jgi:PPK2 family polyphosphate:nucleotide phosphotransferase